MWASNSSSEQRAEDRVALALEEYAVGLDAGTSISRAALLVKYADVADELIGCLDSLDFIRQVAPQISDGEGRGDAREGEAPAEPPTSVSGSESEATARAKPLAALGDFQIIREIGRGGMGVVYEAEQLSLGRRVALKVLPFAAMFDKQQLARFKNEARAAAMLDHPNIVAIYSVGVERGVHFYAMQLIEGESLARVVASLRDAISSPSPLAGEGRGEGVPHPAGSAIHSIPSSNPSTVPHAFLSTVRSTSSREYFRNIAELGIQAAEALDHAHEQGVIHRDIKPANLLLDESGRLWITDFGLARLEADAGMTMTGDLVGTLRYMSPEQALAKRAVVDHRTDVYSLGATLYELLSLRPAFDGEDRQQLLKQIAFEEPPHLRKLNRQIPAELETIVEKAIRKNATERYTTAKELAEDLRSFLAHKPIKAKSPTLREQTTKWMHRHPAAVRAAALFLIATTITSTGSALFISGAYHREAASAQKATDSAKAERKAKESETEQKKLAEASAKRAEAVSKFLVETLRSPDPRKSGRTVTVAELLDRSAKELEDKFADDPRTRSELLHAIGESYMGLGLHQEAIVNLEAARKLRISDLGEGSAETLATDSKLVSSYLVAGRAKDAANLAEEMLRIGIANLESDHPEVQPSTYETVTSFTSAGRLDDALPLVKKIVALRKAKLGPEHRLTLEATYELGWTYIQLHRFKDALALIEEAHKLEERVWGKTGYQGWWVSLRLLATAYGRAGRYDEAMRVHEEALELSQKTNGEDHPFTLEMMSYLAQDYGHFGRVDDAVRLHEKSLKLTASKLGPDHPDTVREMLLLAQIYLDAGRIDEAQKLCEDALDRAKDKWGPSHPYSLEIMANLANVYLKMGRAEDAVQLRDAVLDVANANLAKENLDTLVAIDKVGEAFYTAGQIDEASRTFEELLARAKAALGPSHGFTLEMMNNLAQCYLKARRLDEAICLREEALNLTTAKLAQDDPKALAMMCDLALLKNQVGRYQESADQYREVIRLGPHFGRAYNDLSWLLATCPDRGFRDPKEAARLAGKAVEFDPEGSSVWNTLGVAQYRAGEYAAAVSSLEKAEELSGGAQTAGVTFACDALFLAMAHWQMGDKDDAHKWYNEGVEWIDKKRPTDKELARFREEAQLLINGDQSPRPSDKERPTTDNGPPATDN